ncbi:biliverdin-producing heme oxygenase [Niveispirillum sp.]|uniref:biliverdin-producing heme oxygenase n=1 Tax=Niveispirillum sp. TaxID=1917217 RepID=UPI001B68F24E|nr:biliverdin-producing heme oxygenase [Niveispirillum sp.]MBP7334249.1 biliverdin-producing heme oxygenase [Niveispirillum sp.]
MSKPTVTDAGRAKRLKAATQAAHDSLDKAIMRREPFRDRGRYALFVVAQYQFHRDLDALYDDPVLAALVPDLKARRRLDKIALDLDDLGMARPAVDSIPVPAGDLPTALGWLYVAEGSNLGAALLLKEATMLGLSENFGARHLAGPVEGRGLLWRTFTAALDAVPLTSEQEARVVTGAQAAFARVRALVETSFGA